MTAKGTGVAVPAVEGTLGAGTAPHGSPLGLAPVTHLPLVPRLTPAGFVAGPPATARSAPVAAGPACERSTVPATTAVVLVEFTWIERFGPRNILIVAAPVTDNDAVDVGCRMTSGIGTEIGFKPHSAFAETLKVPLEDRSFANVNGTGSVTVTLM